MANDTSLLGQVKQKLIDSKRKWADEGRLLTGKAGLKGRDRLPPGQHEVKNWPVLDLGVQPKIDLWDWQLKVDGLVDAPASFTFQDLLALPQSEDVSDIHCVTAWSRYDNHWVGVRTRDLIARVRPKPDARFVMCHAYDGYTTNLRLEHFAAEDGLLAHSWEGKPITGEHGGPVRMVIPRWYFWKSAKWIKRIEFTAKDRPGFWENRGYHNQGDPWTEQRYSRD
ncbi:MAG: sulfite oxidase-like oxidoreductase [Alphaproteobacteria bacterium]|nr:sulfite oxidase-like oxidoreductase [Alphaproteobacteria bacterium]